MKKIIAALIVGVLLFSLTACSKKNVMIWPESGLGAVLPDPGTTDGKIYWDSDTDFGARFQGTKEDFETYLQKCRDSGFTVDERKQGSFTYIFNSDGYELTAYHSSDEINVSIDPPIEMKTFKWPDNEASAYLPVPSSNYGKIDREHSDSFLIYVGNTTRADYDKYVEDCTAMGFDLKYSKDEDHYRAYNEAGFYLSLEYKYFDTMYIKIEKKSQDSSSSSESSNSSASGSSNDTSTSTNSEPVTTSSASPSDTSSANSQSSSASSALPAVGIRPEFKKAIDEYEAFFDEYIKVMKNFSNDPAKYMSDYLKMIERYSEAMDKFDELGDGEMSSEELAYYTAAVTRINTKLASIV